MTPSENFLKIVAPINNAEDVQALVEAGASELYCGLLPESWIKHYGYSDFLNKRQGTVANLTSYSQLESLHANAARLKIPVALTLNTTYTEEMLPEVVEIAETWAEMGGEAIMISDPTLFLQLQKRTPKVRRHLSILANPFNHKLVQFFARFGVTRAVLPRELSISEMKQIIHKLPGMEFEVMALNDKCRFVDGLCHFYHSTSFSSAQLTVLPYQICNGRAEIKVSDPAYTGHGCSILFGGRAVVKHEKTSLIPGNPGCAACLAGDLLNAGIGYLKLGGRGLPIQLNLRNVRFFRQVVELSQSGRTNTEQIRTLYQETFGQPCNPAVCYYAEWNQQS